MIIDEYLTAAPAAPAVLTILSEGESFGYQILRRVRELSRDEFDWTDAMVYPLFHRLCRLGYLTRESRMLPGGRRRNYYTITDRGRAALARRQDRRMAVLHALSGMWGGTGWLLAASGAT